MWSPSCILEQSRFQPRHRLQDLSDADRIATVLFIGIAILWVPIANAPSRSLQGDAYMEIVVALVCCVWPPSQFESRRHGRMARQTVS